MIATPQELDRTDWLKLPTRGDALLAEYEQRLLETLLSLEVDLQEGHTIKGLWRLYDTRRLPRLTDEDQTGVQDRVRYEAMLRVIDAMSLSQGADTFRDISRDQVTFWNRTHDWLSTTAWAVSHDYNVLQEDPKQSWGMFKVWLEPVGPSIRAAHTDR